MKRVFLVWLQRFILLALVGAAVWYLPRLDYSAVLSALKEAQWGWVALAVATTAIYWCLRALTLWLVLRLQEPLSYKVAWVTVMLGMLTDQIIPGRVGYLVRWGVLVLKTKLTKSFALSGLLTTIGLEVVSILALVVGIVLFSPALAEKGMLSYQSLALMAAVLVLVYLLVLLSDRVEKFVRQSFLGKFQPLLALIDFAKKAKDPRTLFAWVGSSVLMWGSQFLIAGFAAQALGVSLSFAQLVFLLLALNIAIAVPVVPGNLGSVELVVTAVLTRYGVEQERALVISILYHAIHLLSLGAVGSLVAALTGLNLKQLRAAGEKSR